MERLKILNYNVLHGFHDVATQSSLEPHRLAAAQRTIRKLDPDIVVMTEACYASSTSSGAYLDYCEAFNYTNGYFAQWGAFEWGNMILSKYPIRASTLDLKSRSVLRAHVLHPRERLQVDVVHLDPTLDDHKKAALLRSFVPRNARQYFLVGDFNALSPHDRYPHSHLAKSLAPSTGAEQAELRATDLLHTKPVRFLLNEGLIDSVPVGRPVARTYTFPTRAAAQPVQMAMRLDYIFSSRDMLLNSSRVVRTKDTDIASDHYPVVATYTL